MSPMPEERVANELAAGLDRLSEAVDASTEQVLNAARRRAVERPRATVPAWALGSAAVLALAVGLAVGLALVDRSGEEPHLLAQQPVADAELYQELEFYLWLSEELESE